MAQIIEVNNNRLDAVGAFLTQLSIEDMPAEALELAKTELLRTALETAALDVAALRDQATMQQVLELYNTGKTEDAQTLLNQYISKEKLGLDKTLLAQSDLNKPVDFTTTVEYGFDIANIIIELQKQLDDLRKQSHQIKITERQNALALKLEGAEATVQRGQGTICQRVWLSHSRDCVWGDYGDWYWSDFGIGCFKRQGCAA